MAGKRSIPTDLFWDETFSGLCSDTQSIFIGLVLGADDHGRGPAGIAVLARMLAKDPPVIQASLQDLNNSGFIQCYQVEGKFYYHITRWDEWETLNKPARSRYPAPPELQNSNSEMPGNPPENPGNSQVFLENPSEAEAEEKRREAEEPETPGNVVPFPTRADGGNLKSEELVISELAQVLHLPVTTALTRLVTEFQHVPGLSLLGEANAARAWVDDQRSKRKKQTQMTLPFFRRWLQRSLTINADQVAHTSRETTRATGTGGPARLPDLMHLDDDIRKGEARR
jgi:hypothetical protein